MALYKQPLVSGILSGTANVLMSKNKSVEGFLKPAFIVSLTSLGATYFVESQLRRILPDDMNLDAIGYDVTSAVVVGGTYVALDKLNLISDNRSAFKQFAMVAGMDFISRKITDNQAQSSKIGIDLN